MDNKLSQEEIETLFNFCIKHGVKYYDVQVELVDHLASAIENEMSQNPKLSFEDCLQKEYKSFGNVGFSKLLSERKIAIEKVIKKKRLEILKKSITPPMLFLTLAVFSLPIYLIYNHDVINMKKLNIIYLLIDITIGIYWTIQSLIYRKERNTAILNQQRLKIMMEDIPQVWQISILIMAISNCVQGLTQFKSYDKGDGNFYFIAIFLFINTICSSMVLIFMNENKKLHQYARNQYPEVFVNL